MKSLCVTFGADRPTTATFIGLLHKGVELEVICPSGHPNYQVLKEAGIAVVDLKITKGYDKAVIETLRSRLIDGKFDILHVFNSKALSNGLLAAKGLPVKIVAYRGIVGNVSFIDPVSWLRWLNPRIDRIVCVADAIRDFFLSMKPSFLRGKDEKYIRIYKGHSLDWYNQSPINLAELGIPAGAFVIGCSASYRPRKGIDDLINATNYFPEGENIHLVIVGKMDSKKLRNIIARTPFADKIHLLGFRDDAPEVIAACDAFCLPSKKREGLPRAVIEAMSYSVAPIVTDSGGSPELIVDGESGLIVESCNPQSIAGGILALYSDREKCKAIGVAARQRIATGFRIETTIDETYALYKELMQQ